MSVNERSIRAKKMWATRRKKYGPSGGNDKQKRESCPVCERSMPTNVKHNCPGRTLNEEETILWKYHNAKKGNQKNKNGYHLSFDELLSLVEEAGILPSQIGYSGYQLARYNDIGSYEIGNCRFITVSENCKERNTHGGRSKELCAAMRKRKKCYQSLI